MDLALDLIISCSVFALVGAVAGALTGLIPGLHPNTLAILLLVLFVNSDSSGIDPEPEWRRWTSIGAFLVGVLISHSISEIIPTAMMGVIGDDTAVASLPAQRLFFLGRTDLITEAVLIGGLGSVVLFAVIFMPIRMVMGQPIETYSLLKSGMGPILMAISAVVLLSSRSDKKLLKALILFSMSGAIGMVVLRFQVANILTNTLFDHAWSADASIFLLPAFSGFFAIPSLLFAARPMAQREIITPCRTDDDFSFSRARPLLKGVIPSIIVGWIPGITNAYATALVFAFRNPWKHPVEGSFRYLITYSATNIGGALQAILALGTILRARNGTLEAIASIIPEEQLIWSNISDPPMTIMLFFWSACLSAVAGAAIFRLTAKRLLDHNDIGRAPFLRAIVVILILVLIFWSSGPIGYIVMLPCFLLGVWAIGSGASRIHLMGFLVVPVTIYFLV